MLTRATASVLASATCLLLATANPAGALDTTETFDVGPSDAEMYLGYGGVGLAKVHRELSNEVVFGYGLNERVSTYLASCFAFAEHDFSQQTGLCLGVFGTAVDTDHFDLDLMLDVESTTDDLGLVGFAPGVELNYDRDPEMGTWGLYLRSAFVNFDPGQGADRMSDFIVNPGAYYRLSDRFEVLVEYDAVWGMGDDRDPADDVSGLGFGLNTMVHPALELIGQIHRERPVDEDDATWSLSLGVIATLP